MGKDDGVGSNAPAIRMIGLGKSFGPVVAVQDLDLQVATGEVIGCLGPNGAGKTTTIRLLLGLITPTSGRAEIFGMDSHTETVEAHRRIAYVPGEASLWPGLTGQETLHLLGRIHGSVDEDYREELVERFELDPSKKVRAYSKGNRQKVLLIGALMTRADLLVLDEPTSGLDPLMEQTFRACVEEAKSRGQTVFLSSHILSEVEATCDQVAILQAGRLVDRGRLSEMRHLAAVTVEVSFAGPRPDLDSVPGVSEVSAGDGVVTCRVTGSMKPLLDALRGSQVQRLISCEPSLEDLFLTYYGRASLDGQRA